MARDAIKLLISIIQNNKKVTNTKIRYLQEFSTACMFEQS